MTRPNHITALRAFICGYESGVSSRTLIAALVPVLRNECQAANSGHWDIPFDPQDLLRCAKALDLIRNGRARLLVVAETWPEWRATVDNWDRWRAMLDATLKTGTGEEALWHEMQVARVRQYPVSWP